MFIRIYLNIAASNKTDREQILVHQFRLFFFTNLCLLNKASDEKRRSELCDV